ncbi:hypothetical protein [Cyclobacterium amurskyense]|uniref:Uncharacterized protein n=1 Tax=Cyclobacterium amurskyense TaxID=320787 RepID=A0A0H4PAZ0_9BACT|nr:hypothetical protein [Cyclobacterium amurskyense]AKP49923.1 hypothetical protein CA2015_0453 [Cyclobacterium amurskyense]
MRTYFMLLLLLILFIQGVEAQDIDHILMKKDIEVAETILEGLITPQAKSQALSIVSNGEVMVLDMDQPIPQNNLRLHSGKSNKMRSQYIKGFGVMIAIDIRDQVFNGFHLYNSKPFSDSTTVPTKGAVNMQSFIGDQTFESNIGLGKTSTLTKSIQGFKSDRNDIDKENLITYLLDYGPLISQMAPDDKLLVVLIENKDSGLAFNINDTHKVDNNVSAAITKSDLTDFSTGKINREEAITRIQFSSLGTTKIAQDLLVFASILERLYQIDLSANYYIQQKPSVQILPGFGVIYSINLFSSIRKNKGFYDFPTLNLKNITEKERDDKVVGLYPEFLNEITKQFTTYGKTIKSIAPNERVLLQLTMPSCNTCQMPGTVEISAKAKDLLAFGKGEMNLKQIMQKVVLEFI